MGSKFPAPPALDWSSTNPHAPSLGHVNPGCRPRDPRWLAMPVNLVPGLVILGLTEIRTADPQPHNSSSGGDSVYRLSVIPCVSFSLFPSLSSAPVANANTTIWQPLQFHNVHFTWLPDVCITRPVTDLTFILWTVEHESSKFESQPSPIFLWSVSVIKWELRLQIGKKPVLRAK